MRPYRVLLIDDDEDILEFLSYAFNKSGYQVEVSNNGEAGLELAKTFQPDIILLDVMMPNMDGIEVCEHLRKDEATKDGIIVMLTARGEDYSQIAGLDAGADDYVIKPINPKVLQSRVKALLRRKYVVADEDSLHDRSRIIKIGNIVIDREKYQISDNSQMINLPRKEFELIALLASKPGKVFTRAEIYDKIWGDTFVGDRTIDVHIRKLREKIGSRYIKTVKGVGYRFAD
jgi:two-component system, OmpR family, alkaline phosphatase synthesis response regulator PhoP